MFKEKVIQSEITSLPSGEIQIKTVTTVEKNGEVLSTKVHYDVLQPGVDVSTQSAAVQKIAQATWTPEVIAPFTAQVVQSIQEQATAKATLEAETAAHEVARAAAEKAKVDAEAAQAQAKAAADALEAENKRIAEAQAIADAAAKAAAEKAAFDAAVAAAVKAAM